VKKLMGYLRLMRPANIVTAVSDILAGIAISGYIGQQPWNGWPIILLILSTIGLYGGGVVMNDYFDAELDRVERPERPIPSGLVSKTAALILGVSLLLLGIITAALVFLFTASWISAILAMVITIAALVYDKWTKHHALLGPVNMGACRGLNLLLGISIIPSAVSLYALVAVVPMIYIAAITMISRGEVHGGRKVTLFTAAVLYFLVIAGLFYIALDKGTWQYAIVFIVLWALLIFWPLQKAIARPQGKQIGMAVKAGVIALIVMNASWAAAFSTFYFAILIALLLPLSILLARLFAVT
jgi:4-hydroxybenzoate polyprenyltransferase